MLRTLAFACSLLVLTLCTLQVVDASTSRADAPSSVLQARRTAPFAADVVYRDADQALVSNFVSDEDPPVGWVGCGNEGFYSNLSGVVVVLGPYATAQEAVEAAHDDTVVDNAWQSYVENWFAFVYCELCIEPQPCHKSFKCDPEALVNCVPAENDDGTFRVDIVFNDCSLWWVSCGECSI